MTGICGLLGSSDGNIVSTMLDSLEHRGRGYPEYFSENEALLASKSTRDRHRTAMYSADGLCAIMDGYLENREELILDLERKGHQFDVGLGPEILIRAYGEFDKDFAGVLRGAFSFALWDGRKLLLGRDRLGRKPLFYAHVAEDGLFIFGSEMKAILQHDFERTTNTHAFCQRALIHHIIGNATSLKEISQVPPGQTVIVKPTGSKGDVKIEGIKNSELAFNPNHRCSEEETVSSFAGLLSASIADCGEAGVPPVVLLSGGIDSSLLVAMLDEMSAMPVQTFTFSDDHTNPDIRYARDVSSEFSTRHTEVIFEPDEVVEELPSIVSVTEGLFGGFSFYLASKELKKQMPGTFKAYSGEGPDELFGGYRYFINMDAYKSEVNRKISELGNIEEAGPIREHVQEAFSGGLRSFLLDELGDQMTNSHLLWADHCGMSYGIDICAPYLGDDVVDLAQTIPTEMKIRNGVGKYILRKAAEKFIPKRLKKILTRKKIGAPAATSNIIKRMRRLSEHLITDRDLEQYKYKRFVKWKLNMLMLDLFEYVFVERNGTVPSGFEVSDLY